MNTRRQESPSGPSWRLLNTDVLPAHLILGYTFLNFFILFHIFFTSLGYFTAMNQISFRILDVTFFFGLDFKYGLKMMEIAQNRSENCNRSKFHGHLKSKK